MEEIVEMPGDCFIMRVTEFDYNQICNKIAKIANKENAVVVHMSSIMMTDDMGDPFETHQYYLSCAVIYQRLFKKHVDKIKRELS